jgi:hypothetical protein
VKVTEEEAIQHGVPSDDIAQIGGNTVLLFQFAGYVDYFALNGLSSSLCCLAIDGPLADANQVVHDRAGDNHKVNLSND